jgi:hypothetical protein
MKINKTLKIGGYTYNIILRDIDRTEQSKNFGYVNSNHCEIVLDTGCDIQSRESTFLHEIVEVINTINELGLTHQQIMILEHNLYQILKDNDMIK